MTAATGKTPSHGSKHRCVVKAWVRDVSEVSLARVTRLSLGYAGADR